MRGRRRRRRKRRWNRLSVFVQIGGLLEHVLQIWVLQLTPVVVVVAGNDGCRRQTAVQAGGTSSGCEGLGEWEQLIDV